ncbi:MAG TPA: DHA2 family efflux MFS transporter permease subunit [Acidimicrobiales bacterium]|jgi:EmrB/QacA subfamily drug resistance transporter
MKSDSRKWFALAIICVAQFMVILDVSIVNVALPSIQRGLHFSEQNLLWVLNAYALFFGGFLMLGGRVADKLGRRRVFVVGVVLFTVASLFCGLASSTGWIITSRAVQGLGAAILSPAALSILTVTFEEGRERNTALSIWGAIAGAGGAFGVLLGGILTQEVGWQWIFYVNVPIGSLVVLASVFILAPSLAEDERRGFDIPGAIALTGSLVLMVFGLVKSTSWGWASAKTVGILAVAVVIMAVFVLIERRTASPLVPLAIFGNRSLSASNLVSLALGASIFAMFYFLSLYMQEVLRYSALKTGIGYLAIAGAIIVAAGAAQALVAKVGVRVVMTTGMVLAAGGLIYFTRISPQGSYVGTLLPGFLLAGVGMGLSFVPVTIGAMSGVAPDEAGVASGLITTTQQIGGALGVAVLSTIAVSATTRYVGSHGHSAASAALNHGFSIAFWFAALFAAIGAVLALVGLPRGLPGGEPAMVPAATAAEAA